MSILTSRRFLPLFVTQFLGAFNDSMFKNGLAMLVTYKLAKTVNGDTGILVALSQGIFILPFFLFSATAGQLSDKMDRGQIARYVKIAEIAIMFFATVGFLTGSVTTLMVAVFGMGLHSTFFGPVKYAILPQHLEGKELLEGNAYVEAATFLAILIGTTAGGLLIGVEHGDIFISLAVLAVAGAGYAASRFIPAAPGPSPDLVINKNVWAETTKIMDHIRQDVDIYRCVLAISWFWMIGSIYLVQFIPFARDYLGGNESVATLLSTMFAVGIGAGSVFCNKLLKGRVQATYVPIAAIGMALFGIDLFLASHDGAPAPAGLALTAGQFLSVPSHWRILLDLFMIAFSGGMFGVPLYAMVQKDSDPAYLARQIAGLNVMNAMFMVTGAVATAVLLAMHFTLPQIFLAIALANVLVAVYIAQLLPDHLFRSVARAVFGWMYGVKVIGMENFEKAGNKVLIIANHTSFLDAALIAAYLPVKITFAINTHVAKLWWMQPLMKIVDAFPVDPTNPMAIKSLVDVVKGGKIGMIFPEGRITVTGSLMKVYEGPGLIADKAHAKILPIRIEGAQYTRFSRLHGKVRLRAFPKITLTILEPRDFVLPEGVYGRKRRHLAAGQLYDMMSSMMFDASDIEKPLMTSLIEARCGFGGGHVIAEDPERQPVNYRDFVTRAMVLGRILNRAVKKDPNAKIQAVGVMLPNMVGTALTFFGLHSIRRTPAMLNFSSGPSQIASACKTAMLTSVITSKRFIEMGKMEAVVKALEEAGVTLLYLEDLRKNLRVTDKIVGLFAKVVPEVVDAFRKPADANDPAVILFTSGSEGTPKGVVLSHRNVQANRCQIASRVDFGPSDIVFNCLPMFHSFGLTAGTLLPILFGIRTFYYPSPLHYRIVPELVYDTNATIMFGTDTFLAGYARFAHPYDFHAIRYVFAGAEKLREETRKIYAEKYGVRIFEGYGATETAPVISINTPMHNRPGSVGRLMPGMEHKLESVEGLDGNTGKLMIKGPNIMLGYLKSDAPGILQPPDNGWYDTGDIVGMDGEGFITIQGRLKRFAKIAGEMVSLTAVESAVQKLWPDKMHAVISVKDDKKGEKLILYTTQGNARTEDILQHFRRLGLSELAVPRQIEPVAEIPVLGTGKTDYMSLKKIAEG
ncbi:MAG: acyl-[ACP]--phospholipid O-acyltransferase [Alphaproteobacteria bacterium]|nr:MAG: acyl-[ACP]--phospholipid O-acyltransferase [Alphaproteobacteria bacterium]